MKKILHKTLALFFIFVSSLIGLSNSNAQTGTLTANPTSVTTYPNANGTGNTLLTMTSSGAQKVLITHQSTNGSTTTTETIVIDDTVLSFSDRVINYIQNGRTHTFRLYATTTGSSVLGALLSTVIVTGVVPPPTGTLTASTQNVTQLTPSSAPGVTPITYTNFTVTSASGVEPITYSSGTTFLTWTTSGSIKTMITLFKTKKTGETIPATGGTLFPNGEKIIINGPPLNKTDHPITYIQKDAIHIFKLYAGITTSTLVTNPDAITLGAYLGEFIVYGYDPALGINDQMENRDNEGVTVFNDPLTDQFRIHIIDRKASTIELNVFDIGGKMISAPKIIHGDTDFLYDASTLQKGVYLLKITLDNKTQLVRKIVKI